jgi:hypothetical protein
VGLWQLRTSGWLLVVVAEDQRVQQQEYSHPTITASNAYTVVFKHGLCMTTVMIHSEFLSLFQQPPDATMFLPLTKYQSSPISAAAAAATIHNRMLPSPTKLILAKDTNNDQSKDNDTVSTNVGDDAERGANVSNNQDMDKIAKHYWLHRPDFPYFLPTTASTYATSIHSTDLTARMVATGQQPQDSQRQTESVCVGGGCQ